MTPPFGDWKHSQNNLHPRITMSLITPIKHPTFHPVIKLPSQIELYDFSKGYDSNRTLQCEYGVGKYNEHRPGMYTGKLFEKEARTIHMGVDIGAPAGTTVYAFDDGKVIHAGYNPEPFDYGFVIVTEHRNKDGDLYWVLFGHLSKESVEHCPKSPFNKGEILGWLGDKSENGGWNPHLHIQLSTVRPETHDLPGVVSLPEREQALLLYPDPRIVLGDIY